jgi:hypothetical protein
MGTLPLRAALKRGGLLVAANWPVVVVDFVVESLYKLALSVPVLGGALMVGALVGTDLRDVVADGVRPTADLVLGSLTAAPGALAAFLAALAVVGIGGEALMFVVKAGTLGVIVAADRESADVERGPVDTETLQGLARFRLDLLDGARRFARRAVWLAMWLGGVYVAVGGAYLVVVTYGISLQPRSRWAPAWPVVVVVATSVGVIAMTAANLAYDLLRVVVVTDDCSVRAAAERLRRFVIEDARQVIGIFSVIGGVELLAESVSLLAAAGLTPVAYLPFIGLIIVPLQAAFWLLRGLLFESLAMASLAAYQTQYRRFSSMRWPKP